MYFFASLLGLWMVCPSHIPDSGPIYPCNFTILQGEQVQRRWYWYTENTFFRLNEIYLLKGNTISVTDGVFTHTWNNHPADFNADGFCNANDYDDFVKAFEFGHQWADFDGNSYVNGDDFDKFMDAFILGCD